VDTAVPVLNPQQRDLLPMIQNIASVPKERRENAQWRFGYPVPLRHNRPRVGGEPGGSNVSITRGGP
jgi:hypothetical protein